MTRIVSLDEALAWVEDSGYGVSPSINVVDTSALQQGRLVERRALAVLLLLSRVGITGENRPLSVDLVLIGAALIVSCCCVALAESLRELELSNDAIVRTSARAVPSLSLGSRVHGIAGTERARLRLEGCRAGECIWNTAIAGILVGLSTIPIVETAALLASQELS